jgi:hypothetical protein
MDILFGRRLFRLRVTARMRGRRAGERGPAQEHDPKTCKPDLVTYTPIAVRRLEKFPLSANASTDLGPQNAGDNHTPINCLASAPSLK